MTLRLCICSAFLISATLLCAAESPSIESLKVAAEKGDANSANLLGMAYYSGTGIPQNLEEAARWVRLAAEKNNVAAQCNFAAMLDRGDGVPRDPALALQWYRKAADKGSDLAQVLLGSKYEYADGTTEDKKEAIRWYKKAAKADNPQGQYHLGTMYLLGSGTKENHPEAYFWLNLAVDLAGKDTELYSKARDSARVMLDVKETADIEKRCEKWREKRAAKNKQKQSP